MIQHTVMWVLHDADQAFTVKQLLDSCQALVPGMLVFEVGVQQPGLEANCHVVLNSRFTDAAALAAYQTHPKHQRVSAQIGELRCTRHVLDYYIT